MNVFDEHTIENKISAQKRAEVKLDSPRSTAKRTVRRPADASAGLSGDFLRTLLLMGLVAAATLILLVARLTDRPTSVPALSAAISGLFAGSGPGDTSDTDTSDTDTSESETSESTVDGNAATGTEADAQADAQTGAQVDAQADAQADSGAGEEAAAITESSAEQDNAAQEDAAQEDAAQEDAASDAATSADYSIDGQPLALLLESDLRDPSFPLARDDREAEQKWKMALSTGQGIYQIRVFPGNLAWSTLGFELTQPFRVETSTQIEDGLVRTAADSMELDGTSGYAGLIARYQDPSNFYLFNIDGQGRSQLLSQIDGVWTTISPWTPTALVKPTPEENELAVEDDGQFIRFFVNGAPIHETEPSLPGGLVGLASGTGIQYASLSNFYWIRIYGTK